MEDLMAKQRSRYPSETEFYYSSVTECLALLEALRAGLVEREKETGKADPLLHSISPRHANLMKSLINYYPTGSASQERAWDLLECDGLKEHVGTTPDGYVSLSTDLILENVERAIALTKTE